MDQNIKEDLGVTKNATNINYLAQLKNKKIAILEPCSQPWAHNMDMDDLSLFENIIKLMNTSKPI